jgi:hypothetical protein
VADPDSPSAEAIAEKTGEKPSIKEEITPDEPEEDVSLPENKHKDEPKNIH